MFVRALPKLRQFRQSRSGSSPAHNLPSPRNYSTSSTGSRHASFYSETLPAMIPIFLLGSAVYLGLRLLQHNLSHERHLEAAEARIRKLENDIISLEAERRK